MPTTNGEWLALMQHVGAPTRLVDVTRCPFVAAYFAVLRADLPEWLGRKRVRHVVDRSLKLNLCAFCGICLYRIPPTGQFLKKYRKMRAWRILQATTFTPVCTPSAIAWLPFRSNARSLP
jgi:FRG domain-containing protein